MTAPAVPGADPEFSSFLEWLLTQGYSANECAARCPYKAEEHAHLHSPGNPASKGIPPRDFILWGDGTSSHLDPTQPAAYVPVPVRREPSRPSACYRAAAGFMVHVRPGCRCP